MQLLWRHRWWRQPKLSGSCSSPSGPHWGELHSGCHGRCERMWLGLLERHPLLGGLCVEQRQPDPAPGLLGNSRTGTHAAPRYREDSGRRPRFRQRRDQRPIRPMGRGLPIRVVSRRPQLVPRVPARALCRGGSAVEPGHV